MIVVHADGETIIRMDGDTLKKGDEDWTITDKKLELEAGNYKLGSSITTNATISVTGTVTLDLNGYGITANTDSENRFSVITTAYINLLKTVKNLDAVGNVISSEEQNFGAVNTVVLEIAVPYDTSKEGLTVYRYHGAQAGRLTGRNARAAEGSYVDGTFYVGNGYIYIYASGFSTYAIAAAREESEEETDWLEPFRTKLHNAGEAGGAQTVEFEGGFALPKEFMEYLKAHPQITLVYHVNYEGKKFTVTIPGKNVIVEENTDWYGPLWLNAHYGKGAANAGTVFSPKTGDYGAYASPIVLLVVAGIAVTAVEFCERKKNGTIVTKGERFTGKK